MKLGINCWQCVEKEGESRTARRMTIAKIKIIIKVK